VGGFHVTCLDVPKSKYLVDSFSTSTTNVIRSKVVLIDIPSTNTTSKTLGVTFYFNSFSASNLFPCDV